MANYYSTKLWFCYFVWVSQEYFVCGPLWQITFEPQSHLYQNWASRASNDIFELITASDNFCLPNQRSMKTNNSNYEHPPSGYYISINFKMNWGDMNCFLYHATHCLCYLLTRKSLDTYIILTINLNNMVWYCISMYV